MKQSVHTFLLFWGKMITWMEWHCDRTGKYQ